MTENGEIQGFMGFGEKSRCKLSVHKPDIYFMKENLIW